LRLLRYWDDIIYKLIIMIIHCVTWILRDGQQHRTFVDCDDIHWFDGFDDDGIVSGCDGSDDGDELRDENGGKDDEMDL